jgi:hypothetical protein
MGSIGLMMAALCDQEDQPTGTVMHDLACPPVSGISVSGDAHATRNGLAKLVVEQKQESSVSIMLGKMGRIDLRHAWKNEASDFTPWLAENLSLIGETIGIDLELQDK